MKKHLIAAAVAAAVAVPAVAQVTVSGVLDVGVFQDKVDGQRGIQNVRGAGTRSSPVLTLSGSEDLGGGLKAGFTLQGNLGADTGRLGAISGTENKVFDRFAFVSLSGGFGEVQLGKTTNAVDTRQHAAANGFNINLSVIGGVGKQDNSLRYLSPRVSGLQADLTKVNGEVRTAGDPGVGDHLIYGINYVQGPFAAGYSVAKVKRATAATNLERSVIDFAYDFGLARVAVSRNVSERETRVATDSSVDAVTVAVPFGGAYRVVLGLHEGKDLVTAGNKATVTTLGLDYRLSKRTTAYGAYSDTSREGTSALKGATNEAIGTTVANKASKLFGVGIVHSF